MPLDSNEISKLRCPFQSHGLPFPWARLVNNLGPLPKKLNTIRYIMKYEARNMDLTASTTPLAKFWSKRISHYFPLLGLTEPVMLRKTSLVGLPKSIFQVRDWIPNPFRIDSDWQNRLLFWDFPQHRLSLVTMTESKIKTISFSYSRLRSSLDKQAV